MTLNQADSRNGTRMSSAVGGQLVEGAAPATLSRGGRALESATRPLRKTHCSTCPAALTKGEQTMGVSRCRRCRKAEPRPPGKVVAHTGRFCVEGCGAELTRNDVAARCTRCKACRGIVVGAPAPPPRVAPTDSWWLRDQFRQDRAAFMQRAAGEHPPLPAKLEALMVPAGWEAW